MTNPSRSEATPFGKRRALCKNSNRGGTVGTRESLEATFTPGARSRSTHAPACLFACGALDACPAWLRNPACIAKKEIAAYIVELRCPKSLSIGTVPWSGFAASRTFMADALGWRTQLCPSHGGFAGSPSLWRSCAHRGWHRRVEGRYSVGPVVGPCDRLSILGFHGVPAVACSSTYARSALRRL
jgi:hypothetical protein